MIYPISAKQKLFLKDIADHWSREITPPMKFLEVLDDLVKAWWRGELTAVNAPSRPDMLRLLYKEHQNKIAFVLPGSEEPAQYEVSSDDEVRVFLPRPSVPLPNFQPDSWDDTNCAEAFEAVAEAWDCNNFSDVAISLHWIQLTVVEFMSWIDTTPCRTPTFWQIAVETKGVNERNQKPLTERTAVRFVQTYVHDANAAGRRPTQAGAEEYIREQGLNGGREFARKAFKGIMKGAGVDIKPGRPKNLRNYLAKK